MEGIMARVVKERTERRNEILDVAQRLVMTKGYEQMTIQDILDALQISKGAFYHHFDSKQALLEALVERMGEEALKILQPIVHDPQLPALDKFQRYLDTLNRWKVGRKDFFIALLRGWYADDNAIVRQKLRTTALREVAPLFSEIIRQGIREGVMTVAYPDQVGEVIMSMAYDAGEAIGMLLLSFDAERGDMQRIERTVAVYTDAFERVLGLRAGSLVIVDTETLKRWAFS
jgi:AcrR family transcriptional regulator